MSNVDMSVVAVVVLSLAACMSLAEAVIRMPVDAASTPFTSREANIIHVAMNGGMALMFTELYDHNAALLLTCVYALLSLALMMRIGWLWNRAPRTRRAEVVGGSVYHLVGLVAMIYAIRLMPMPAGAMSMVGMTMPAHDMPLVATALGAIFLLDGVVTFLLVAFAPHTIFRMGPRRPTIFQAHEPTQQQVRYLRMLAIPHVIMDVGMAIMLI